MRTTQQSRIDTAADVSPLPGARTIRDIRHLVLAAAASAGLYSLLMVASRGGCFGGIDTASGDFIDYNGQLTETEPLCYSLQLGPSPFVLLALGIIVVSALTRVLRTAKSEAEARRTLARATLAIVLVTLGSMVIAVAWFMLLPLEEWQGTGTLIFPFPFADVDIETWPLSEN
ncbi:hypothetical protein C5B85_18160 [Pseudoclavibacter sp. AY1F1]|uniref:hypothetical protein n=1 Tax=Pseudoclavibacter sp. AY1F1 TaxID=2080583 RepID=UPI000CE74384|nr:hypothetical protein [Pseudoclavibacter sp. AY1F1]PPF41930.1 hypothetical protein C5B85_18160 [Pseudoclavibacter sp. AY1F1]